MVVTHTTSTHAPAGPACSSRHTTAKLARWCIYAIGAAALAANVEAVPVPSHGASDASRVRHHHAARNAAISSSASAVASDFLKAIPHPPRIGVLQGGEEEHPKNKTRDMSDSLERAKPRIQVPTSLASMTDSAPHRKQSKTKSRSSTKTSGSKGTPSAVHRGSESVSSGVIDSDDKLRKVINNGLGVSINADGLLEPIIGKGATFQGSMFHQTSISAHNSLHSKGLKSASSMSHSVNQPQATSESSSHKSSKSSSSPSSTKHSSKSSSSPASTKHSSKGSSSESSSSPASTKHSSSTSSSSAFPTGHKFQASDNGNNNDDGNSGGLVAHFPSAVTLKPVSSAASSSAATSTGTPSDARVIGEQGNNNGNNNGGNGDNGSDSGNAGNKLNTGNTDKGGVVNDSGRSAAQNGDGDSASSSSSSSSSSSAGSSSGKKGPLPKDQAVVSNNPAYGFAQAQEDLFKIRKWAGDMDQLVDKKHRNETLMALFDGAARYFPEVDTKKIVRVFLSEIQHESDFRRHLVSGARLDSGKSVGLMQVSPGDQSTELKTFQKYARSNANTYSWTIGSGTEREVKHGGESGLGPLMDYKTNEEMDIHKLTNDDLYRPWINIHVAMWIQSNNARTGSQDPSKWPSISKASREVRKAYEPFAQSTSQSSSSSGSNAGSDSNANSNSSASSSSSAGSGDTEAYEKALKKLEDKLSGKNKQPRTVATALGSWVAGTADNGGGYETQGDEISHSYFKHVGKALAVLYGHKGSKAYGKSWLNKLELTAGLVDFSEP